MKKLSIIFTLTAFFTVLGAAFAAELPYTKNLIFEMTPAGFSEKGWLSTDGKYIAEKNTEAEAVLNNIAINNRPGVVFSGQNLKMTLDEDVFQRQEGTLIYIFNWSNVENCSIIEPPGSSWTHYGGQMYPSFFAPGRFANGNLAGSVNCSGDGGISGLGIAVPGTHMVTLRASKVTGIYNIFIDGVKKWDDYICYFSSTWLAPTTIFFGGSNGDGAFFNGAIGDVLFYNEAVPDADLRRIHTYLINKYEIK